MKFLMPLALAVLMLAQPARTDAAEKPADWNNYDGGKYGVSFSYPAYWFMFENVNTEFKAHGLPSVFNLCLTPGPVKTLSCQIDFYVIPEAKFTPPAKDAFLGLPVTRIEAPSAGAVWGPSAPFSVAQGETSYYAAHNGFVYLWTERAGRGTKDDLNRMRNSFVFTAPAGDHP